jgi:transcriptional regulator with XRE-family HTH domain
MGRYAFPENLRRIRKQKGITQVELAEKVGVTQTSISYYEQCIEYPTIDRVYDIARALDVTIEALITAQ